MPGVNASMLHKDYLWILVLIDGPSHLLASSAGHETRKSLCSSASDVLIIIPLISAYYWQG